MVARVTRAAVRVAGETVGRIDSPGLAVLIGVTHADDAAVADRMAEKLWGLRILHDERSVSGVAWPDSEEGRYARRLLTPFVVEGTTPFLSEATRLRILELVVNGPVRTREWETVAQPDWITADEVGTVVADLVADRPERWPLQRRHGSILVMNPSARSET